MKNKVFTIIGAVLFSLVILSIAVYFIAKDDVNLAPGGRCEMRSDSLGRDVICVEISPSGETVYPSPSCGPTGWIYETQCVNSACVEVQYPCNDSDKCYMVPDPIPQDTSLVSLSPQVISPIPSDTLSLQPSQPSQTSFPKCLPACPTIKDNPPCKAADTQRTVTGECIYPNTNEGQSCVVTGGGLGNCKSGTCVPIRLIPRTRLPPTI